MNNNQEIQRLIQSHKALEPFDYKVAVDWAVDLIQEGEETENTLILASFSEPIEKWEISPYVTAVLNELGLNELECDDAIIAQTHFILLKVLNDINVRNSLGQLYKVCINNNMDDRIMNFYLIYHAWNELEEIGANYYYERATLENIEGILKQEARKWIDQYINGNEIEEIGGKPTKKKEEILPSTTATSNKGFIAKLKNWFS